MRFVSIITVISMLASAGNAGNYQSEIKEESVQVQVEGEAPKPIIGGSGAWIVPLVTLSVIGIAIYLSSGKIE